MTKPIIRKRKRVKWPRENEIARLYNFVDGSGIGLVLLDQKSKNGLTTYLLSDQITTIYMPLEHLVPWVVHRIQWSDLSEDAKAAFKKKIRRDPSKIPGFFHE